MYLGTYLLPSNNTAVRRVGMILSARTEEAQLDFGACADLCFSIVGCYPGAIDHLGTQAT